MKDIYVVYEFTPQTEEGYTIIRVCSTLAKAKKTCLELVTSRWIEKYHMDSKDPYGGIVKIDYKKKEKKPNE